MRKILINSSYKGTIVLRLKKTNIIKAGRKKKKEQCLNEIVNIISHLGITTNTFHPFIHPHTQNNPDYSRILPTANIRHTRKDLIFSFSPQRYRPLMHALVVIFISSNDQLCLLALPQPAKCESSRDPQRVVWKRKKNEARKRKEKAYS